MKIEVLQMGTRGIQDFYKSLGENGCYLFSLIEAGFRLTKKAPCLSQCLSLALSSDGLFFDFENYQNPKNFFVKDASLLLHDIYGGKWEVQHIYKKPDFLLKEEAIINCWEWVKENGKISTHFNLPDWDSLRFSHTVHNGQIKSYRCVHRIS